MSSRPTVPRVTPRSARPGTGPASARKPSLGQSSASIAPASARAAPRRPSGQSEIPRTSGPASASRALAKPTLSRPTTKTMNSDTTNSAPAGASPAILEAIDHGFQRRDPAFIQSVFESFSQEGSAGGPAKFISDNRLGEAFAAAHARIPVQNVTSRLSEGGMDLAEFARVIRQGDVVEQWLGQLPLASMIADAMYAMACVEQAPDASPDQTLDRVVAMGEGQLNHIVNGVSTGLQKMLGSAVEELRISRAAQSKQAQQIVEGENEGKFQVRVLESGKISEFHSGLADRLGLPNLDFLKSMCDEHTAMPGSHDMFTANNYNIETCPADEWAIVVDGADPKPEHQVKGRMIPKIEELMELKLTQDAGLSKHEVIAVVLYTGPMFVLYNCMLRRFPHELYDRHDQHGNKFVTTINVLVSAVTKLCRVTAIPDGLRLYRGLGGFMDLPDHFHHADKQGCRGFVEWGFMSTTSDQDVALEYSGVVKGRPKAMVMMIEPNSVDRGACIMDYSQFQAEVEYLIVPCSFVQPLGPHQVKVLEQGVVTIVPVQINVNLKTLTVEELLERKKQTHMTAFRYTVAEAQHQLRALSTTAEAVNRKKVETIIKSQKITLAELAEHIVSECEQEVERHRGVSAEEFSKDEAYRAMVIEMLQIKAWALHKFKWWLNDPTRYLHDFVHEGPGYISLQRAHRGYVKWLKKQMRSGGEEAATHALELLKVRGIVKESVEERNMDEENVIVAGVADGMSLEDIRAVLTAGARPVYPEPKEQLPVFAAAESSNHEALQVLLEAGGDPTEARPDDGATAIYIAAQEGSLECLEILKAAGGDVDVATSGSVAPIYVASQNGHAECVRWLIANNANIEAARSSGTTPAFVAAMNGRTECLRLLIEAGADVNKCKTKSESSPLLMTAEKGHPECMKLLLAAGAQVDKAKESGSTPLFQACAFGKAPECVKLLLDAGAKVGLEKIDGYPPLYAAVKNLNTECVRYMLEAGANPNTHPPRRAPAVFLAATSGRDEILKMLLDSGADATVEFDGQTLLEACERHPACENVVKEHLAKSQ